MFDFWYELPPLLRAGFGVLLILVAAAIWFFSGGRTYAYGAGIVGLVMVLASNAGGDSNGYKF